jgi:hypothetical protein
MGCGQKICNEAQTLHVLTTVGMAVVRGVRLHQADLRRYICTSRNNAQQQISKLYNYYQLTVFPIITIGYRMEGLEKVAVLNSSPNLPFFFQERK